MVVAKGRKVQEWKPSGRVPAELLKAMLGPTGNLRAPAIRRGRTVVVGFDEQSYERLFG